MKTIQQLFVFIYSLTSICCFSQTANSKYWIGFTDKNNSPYSVNNPSTYLSAKAIQRRLNQGISIKENDLPVNPSYIDSVLKLGGITLLNKSKWFNAITIYTTDSTKLVKINALPFVTKTFPVATYKGKREVYTQIPQSTAKKEDVGSYNYGRAKNQTTMINGDCLHDLGYHGEGMTIAVIDAGFYNVPVLAAFDSIRLNNRILGTWDFVVGHSDVYNSDSHGTEVLSAMAAYLPGQLIGTAPKAKYWLLRSEVAETERIIEEDNWVTAAEYADSVGSDVINTSLGYNTFDDPSQDHTYADMDGNTTRITIGADIAASKGILVVCSAGNEGNVPWKFIAAPADADSVLSVGAVDSTKNYAPFSSQGPTADGRIKPEVSAQGAGVALASINGSIQTSSGTSFSSPIIAGMATCLWQANPTLTNMQIIEAIKKSASQYNNPDNLLGYGIPNFCVANLLLSGIDPGNFQEDNLMKLYPNPFTSKIEINYYSSNNQTFKMELFDITGKRIFYNESAMKVNSSNNLELDLSFLDKAIYILSITSEKSKFIKKVVKQ